MRMLIQTQLSNYDANGTFILECDSGWQMMMGRIRVMMKLDPDLHIDIMGPMTEDSDYDGTQGQLKTDPFVLNHDLFKEYGDRLRYIPHWIIANALATRYDFNFDTIGSSLDLKKHKIHSDKRYDIVYLNDPMHLRNFKALFHIVGGYTPKFVVHSHFIDNPDCPKFPEEASLWLGQCEAAIKADLNFWQCESAMKIFFEQMAKTYHASVVKGVWKKSYPWDDGYSSGEIIKPYEPSNIRFDIAKLKRLAAEKAIVFVPNRIGEKGRSSDYTNCGHFMFNSLSQLSTLRASATGGKRDYVVLCGNPSQKILNDELENRCGKLGYVNLVPDAFNRDEFKCVASHSHISIGLYNQDSYGGTVARECVELGCLPLWLKNYEYETIAFDAHYGPLAKPNLSNVPKILSQLIDLVKDPFRDAEKLTAINKLQAEVRDRCSYEATTKFAYAQMKTLLNE